MFTLGCEYGDMYSWCSTYVANNANGDCNTLGESIAIECCESCSEIGILSSEPTTHELPSIDASWCRDSFPGMCYDSDSRQVCQAFCAENYHQDNPGKK